MLRHARALSFPPATIVVENKNEVLSRASELQESAAQFEIIIADFLRSYAVANSAILNYQDLLRKLSENSDDEVLLLLAQAEQSALTFYSLPKQETKDKMQKATQVLLQLDLSEKLLNELQTQVRLLADNLPS